jgi:uncharacterized membrane protein
MAYRQPPLNTLDICLEIVGLLSLAAVCVIPIIFFSEMPAQIPIHYDWGGTPESYGPKIRIMVIPLIGVLTYAILYFFRKYSGRLNLPVPVTEANREQMLNLNFQMMRWIRLTVALLFLFIVSSTVQVALGKSQRADTHIMIYFLLAITAIMGIHMYRMINLHQEPED